MSPARENDDVMSAGSEVIFDETDSIVEEKDSLPRNKRSETRENNSETREISNSLSRDKDASLTRDNMYEKDQATMGSSLEENEISRIEETLDLDNLIQKQVGHSRFDNC